MNVRELSLLERAPISALHRGGWFALTIACLAFVLLFLLTYPMISGIEDEVGFVNQALVWSHGAVSSEAAGFAEVVDEGDGKPHLADFILVGGRHVPSRHPGRSLILLPFVAVGGVGAGFLSGLLIHLATTLVAGGLLARFGKSPAWAVLVLFHPTLALYSRTILGDEAAGGFILLAAFFATVRDRRGAAAAGLSAGLAAVCRYHAALALAVVAASIAIDPQRLRRRGDALACLAAGGAVGAMLVGYNLWLYHAPLDAPGSQRGVFGLRYLAEQVPFYTAALLAVWPGMLLAPALDRTAGRVIARGVAAVFFAFFSLYYWHDKGSSFAETLVLGLRLIQTALPVWIVSYATVLDDYLAAPLRRRIGPRAAAAAAVLAAAALFGADALAFVKHQAHLRGLIAVRDAVAANIPAGSVVVEHGAVMKLFGIPGGRPVYSWRRLNPDGEPYDDRFEPMLDTFREPWYLAVFSKGRPTLNAYERGLVARRGMTPAPVAAPGLLLYRADPARGLPSQPPSRPGPP